MTRLAQKDHHKPSDEVTLTLTLTMAKNGDIDWFYSEKVIILGAESSKIRIVLDNRTGLEAKITTYASTGVSARHSPIKFLGLGPNDHSIEIRLTLLPNQLIDFGVFVHFPDIEKTIFCDPQASNDPIKTP